MNPYAYFDMGILYDSALRKLKKDLTDSLTKRGLSPLPHDIEFQALFLYGVSNAPAKIRINCQYGDNRKEYNIDYSFFMSTPYWFFIECLVDAALYDFGIKDKDVYTI